MSELSPKKLAEQPETLELMASLNRTRSRRSLLKGLAVGATGAVTASAAAMGALPMLANLTAEAATTEDTIPAILSIARTAEQLAVTFYGGGIANSSALGLMRDEVNYLIAARAEEQIHLNLFKAAGGKSLADTFALPLGPSTFSSLAKFITTQQILEGVFDAAFLAAVKSFAILGHPELAQLSCQIAMIESEHRVLGRAIAQAHGIKSFGPIASFDIPDDWAFAPVLFPSVTKAAAFVASAGVFSPKPGNSFRYVAVSTSPPQVKILNRTPGGQDHY